ncbi:hypothetical protein Cgig2_033677 [Carnegiea gigantea]|uniref:Uncharacterized protein n=1 Tax=Carnegiea gigantea TaxID=171969 RepID=A0A9Q1JN65_9CARY|nr:hypothetical protein Cgig2_033677 [Carnegiea gigantea]
MSSPSLLSEISQALEAFQAPSPCSLTSLFSSSAFIEQAHCSWTLSFLTSKSHRLRSLRTPAHRWQRPPRPFVGEPLPLSYLSHLSHDFVIFSPVDIPYRWRCRPEQPPHSPAPVQESTVFMKTSPIQYAEVRDMHKPENKLSDNKLSENKVN